MINRFAGNDDDVAAIMHSGGTSAEPKSILLTNANFNSVAVNTKRAIVGERAKEKDAMAMVLPMFHAFGLGVCVHTVLCGGVKSTLIPRYSPERIVHYLKQGHITMISGVPTMYRGLVNKKEFNCRQLKNLRFAFCGGDIFSDELKKDFDSIMARRKSPCVLDNGFGLTEVTGVFSVNKAGARRDGSCGRPIGEDYLIEAFDDNGQKLARGKSGELCISSASVMKGYMNDKQATEQTFLECDGKRWLKTGDWGYVDADGFIFVQQRLKRIIKVSGVPVLSCGNRKACRRAEGRGRVLRRRHRPQAQRQGSKAVCQVCRRPRQAEKDGKRVLSHKAGQMVLPESDRGAARAAQNAYGKDGLSPAGAQRNEKICA